MRMRTLLTCGAVTGLVSGAALAGDLTIGDPAPEVEISHWISGGSPVESFEDGKVYVMEFWATWCGPCRASMPHISELQNKFADYDVRFIGVSDEELSTVVDFLTQKRSEDDKQWHEIIEYTLTTDPDRSVYNDYMKAAAQNGIPTAFIVGKTGQVEWIGHPMRIDQPLADVVHDTWDRESFKTEFEAKTELARLMRDQDYEGALKRINELLDKSESDTLLLQKFNLLLLNLDRPDEAYAVGDKLVKSYWDNAQMLNSIAWTVVDNPNVSKRNIPFAMKAAERASELTEYKDGMILDTLARAYYEKGDLDKAVEWQREAVEHTEPGPMKEQIEQVLEKYENDADGN